MQEGASQKGLSAAPAGQTVSGSTGTSESVDTTRSRKAQASPGLEFPRFFSTAGVDPFDQVEWELRDAIIGNPPFLGAKLLRPSLGDDYVDWLVRQFGVGVKDLCVYWFRRAHEHLQPEQRAGLVGTNSISQTTGRLASLAYIASTGGVITDGQGRQDSCRCAWPERG